MNTKNVIIGLISAGLLLIGIKALSKGKTPAEKELDIKKCNEDLTLVRERIRDGSEMPINGFVTMYCPHTGKSEHRLGSTVGTPGRIYVSDIRYLESKGWKLKNTDQMGMPIMNP